MGIIKNIFRLFGNRANPVYEIIFDVVGDIRDSEEEDKQYNYYDKPDRFRRYYEQIGIVRPQNE